MNIFDKLYGGNVKPKPVRTVGSIFNFPTPEDEERAKLKTASENEAMQKLFSEKVAQGSEKIYEESGGLRNVADMNEDEIKAHFGEMPADKPFTSGIPDAESRMRERGVDPIYKDMPIDEFAKFAEAKKDLAPHTQAVDSRPAIGSGMFQRDFVKSIFPELPDDGDISIGEVKQRINMLRREDLGRERDSRRDERIGQRTSEIVSRFNSDASIKKSQQSLDSAGDIKDLALSGNPIAAGAIPTYAARMSGEVGNLSEADKAPFGGSRAIMQRIDAAMNEWSTGQLSDSNKEFIVGLTDIIEKRANEKMDALAKIRAKQYSKIGNGIYGSEQDILRILRPESTPIDANVPSKPKVANEQSVIKDYKKKVDSFITNASVTLREQVKAARNRGDSDERIWSVISGGKE